MSYSKGMMTAIIVGVFFAGLGVGYSIFGTPLQQQVSSLQSEIQATKSELADLKVSMVATMKKEPQDVIIKVKSVEKVLVGKEAEMVLLVLDKETEQPLPGLQVIVGIDRQESMSLMHMASDLFEAEDAGSGEYIIRFTPDSEGNYTVHAHVVLPGRALMDNHLGIGITAEKENSA